MCFTALYFQAILENRKEEKKKKFLRPSMLPSFVTLIGVMERKMWMFSISPNSCAISLNCWNNEALISIEGVYK